MAAHTPDDYLDQAATNAELARYLRKNRPEDLDWAATCLFYAAIHYVNAYLRHTGQAIPRRHHGADGRQNIVQTDLWLQTIWPDYRALDDDSRDARYELCKPTKGDYDSNMVKRLFRIKEHIMKKVKP